MISFCGPQCVLKIMIQLYVLEKCNDVLLFVAISVIKGKRIFLLVQEQLEDNFDFDVQPPTTIIAFDCT